MAFCVRKYAFLVVDPPPNASADGLNDKTPGAQPRGHHRRP
jgi:hypothetical protein